MTVLRGLQIERLTLDFQVEHCKKVSDSTMCHFTKNNPNINYLKISGEHSNIRACMDSKCFDHIAQYCTSIEYLDINSRTDVYSGAIGCCFPFEVFHFAQKEILLNRLFKSKKKLERLELQLLGCIPNIDILIPILGQHCENLQSLLIDCSESSTQMVVEDEHIEIFTKGCPHLRCLNLGSLFQRKCKMSRHLQPQPCGVKSRQCDIYCHHIRNYHNIILTYLR